MKTPPVQPQAFADCQWTPQPKAWEMVLELSNAFQRRCPAAAALATRMRDETATRFVDWLDTLVLPHDDAMPHRLQSVGYEPEPAIDASDLAIYRQPQGVFPRIALHRRGCMVAFIKVDSVRDFAAAYPGRMAGGIEGGEGSPLRKVCVAADATAELWAIERHGDRSYEPPRADSYRADEVQANLEAFRMRRRDFSHDAEGLDALNGLFDAALRALGRDRVCDLFFQAEREYWMGRNRAAQAQYARQQRLGLGWANHDHHTYRSSRGNFSGLVALWEKLGFVIRERFYAGAEAGWGAQVMEQPTTGIITFNDVDLSPDELLADFAHEPLPPRESLGTVGLWCALHGDSVLQAGMHHLECQFDFDLLKQQLSAEAGVQVMKPFTDFPHLRQAFTEGERWQVRPERIDRLLRDGRITREQAEQFHANGAIGSHLENLERNDGFKGFNQQGVSDIIARTDPRRHVRA